MNPSKTLRSAVCAAAMPAAEVTSPAAAARSAAMRSMNSPAASAVLRVASTCSRSTVRSAMASAAACGLTLRHRGEPTPLVEGEALVPHHRVQPLDLTPGLGLDLAGLGQLRVALGQSPVTLVRDLRH